MGLSLVYAISGLILLFNCLACMLIAGLNSLRV